MEKFERYSIEPVKLVKTDKSESYTDVKAEEVADEYILMGHYTAIHGINVAEAIFASGNKQDVVNMYERIAGVKYGEYNKSS